jgi:hypothetical protein
MATEIYECVLSGTLAGQFVQTVTHWSIENSGSTSGYAVAKDLNEDFAGSGGFIEAFVNRLPGDYVCTSSRVKKANPVGGPTNIILAGAMTASTGGAPSGISSAQVNPLVILIGTTTPSHTGRIFMPGVSEDDIDDMQYSPAWLTAMADFTAFLEASHVTSTLAYTYRNCIGRRKKTSPYNILSGDLTAAAYISPLVGTQRRRLHPV